IVLLGLVGIRVAGGSAGRIPLDLESVASGPGRLDRIADDGNAKRQRNHLGHALDLCDVAQVEDFDLGALDRSFQHRGVDHVRNLTSIPYLAVPLTFSGTSTRPMSLRPISLNCAGFFKSAAVIFGSSAGTPANLATSP